MQLECYTNDTSATRVKKSILITTRVKSYFHTPMFTIWQVKDYKERNNFIQELPFGNALFPCKNAFVKCTTKAKHLIAKDMLYIRL